MLKGFSMRFVRDRRMIRFGRRWNTTHVASEVPAAHHHADENGMTALHWEAKKGCPDVVKSLVDAGADIEARNSLGRSPLLVACENGNFAKAKMLVKAGASVRATDNERETCLTLAAHHGHKETVRYLVGLPEVEVNHEGLNKHTALHSALLKAHSDVVQVLIDAGADIEAKDQIGYSPVHLACRSGTLAIVKMLVDAGAGVHLRDNEGGTCLMLAGDSGYTDIVHYLENLSQVDVKQTDRLDNTALEAAPEQGTATKEEVKALQEMMKSVMDQQKEMLEAQKGVLGSTPTQQTAPVSEQPQQGGMAELRAVCAEMRETVRQCSEHNTKLAEECKRLAEEVDILFNHVPAANWGRLARNLFR